VGDIMLDRYWWGSVSRISPEAPVPVVRLEKTSLIAGGAANVAVNVSNLGAEAFLVGVVGIDEEAKLFPEILKTSNVSADFLVKTKNRPTTIKTRVVAHSQQVVRIDQETKETLSPEDEEKIWDKIENLFEMIDIVIISDYAKGVLTENLLSRLITKTLDKKKYILVDPKGKNYLKYTSATILTPNKREAAEACNLEEDGKLTVEKAGNKLLYDLNLEALLITQGEEGMTLFQKNSKPLNLPALARDVYDVTGAGDTVIATLAVGLGAGATFAEASNLANIAAGLVVEQIGTTSIKFEELKLKL
jgi:D-beta-D-heptose 7-phosphate kinase/D-beta-D-heptose 1-phosphate adenosyltransferase